MKDLGSSKHRPKKNGNEAKPASVINLIAAILNLVTTILLLLDRLTK